MTAHQPPPIPAPSCSLADESHLNTLSVLHFVLGGFSLLGLGFIIIHFALMATVFASVPVSITSSTTSAAPLTPSAPGIVETTSVTGSTELLVEAPYTPGASALTASHSTPHAFIPRHFLWIVGALYLCFGLLALAFCICNVLSGFWIKKRKNRKFSIVIAAINCLQFPIGTALGVFTLMVLARPTVEMSYQSRQPL